MKKYLDENGVLKLLEGLKTQINNAKKKVFDTKGIANGIASLDENGNVPLSQLGNVDNTLFEIVNVLPTELTEKQKNHIFIVPIGMENESDKNAYKEYIYTGEDLGHIDPSYWEELGEFTAEVDLRPYSKKNETMKDIEVFNPNFDNDDADAPSKTSIRIELADETHKYVDIPEASGPFKVINTTYPGNAGFMSVSDKIKLDNIDVNAFSKPDEEDITSKVVNNEHVLKFADKEYKPENFSGKGYKYLRKNIQKINLAVTKITVNSAPTKDGEISVTINNINTNISLVKNIHNTPALVAQVISDTLISAHTDYDIEVTNNIITLTRKYSGEVASSTFNVSDTGVTINIEDSVKSVNRNVLTSDMIRNPNTIYEVRYDFDFENETIVLPKDSILHFEGGSFSNVTLEGDNTTIQAQNYEIFKNVTLTGTWDTADFYVEWFGAKGDGVNDDTASIQKALDVVLSVTLPFHITVHLSKTYRITDTLNIHAETTLKGNFIGSYMNYAKTQYKCIVADFSDTKKWIVQSSNLKNSAYNANLGKNPVDSGTIKYQEAIRIEDVKIESSNTNNPAFGGIRIIASSNSSIKNCSVFHTLYGIYRMATWYSSDSDNYVVSLICPLVMGNDMNAFSVINGYYMCSNKVLDDMYNEENMLICDNKFKYKKCIFAIYARGIFLNVITEHANIARVYRQCTITDISGWIEAVTQAYEMYATNAILINIYSEVQKYINMHDSNYVRTIGNPISNIYGSINADAYSYNSKLIYTPRLSSAPRGSGSRYNDLSDVELYETATRKHYWWTGEYWGDSNGNGIQTKYDGSFNNIPYDHKTKNGSVYINTDNNTNIPIFQFKQGNLPYLTISPTNWGKNPFTEDININITLFGEQIVTNKKLSYSKDYTVSDYFEQVMNMIHITNKFVSGNRIIIHTRWKEGDKVDYVKDIDFKITNAKTGENIHALFIAWYYFKPVKPNFVDALGFNANLAHRGTTEQRPTPTASDEGFEYYDSTLKKKILWNGTKWVNLDGTELS